jgi:lipopolysaccharide export system protein LptC
MNFSFLSNNLLRRDLKIYALVLLLAASSWGIVEIFRVEYKTDAELHEAPQHSADYFSNGYLRKDLNEQGQLKSELSAQNILHYSDDDTTHIDKPKLTLYNSDPSIPPWVVQSEKGILSADGENLLLQGQVFIDKAAAKGSRQLNIRTTNLQVKPKISYAEGDEWVELISPPHRIEAKGIQMTFKRPIHINLLSRVKSRYVLNK